MSEYSYLRKRFPNKCARRFWVVARIFVMTTISPIRYGLEGLVEGLGRWREAMDDLWPSTKEDWR